MKQFRIPLFAVIFVAVAAAQAPRADQIQGLITSVNPQANQVVLTTDKGDTVTVTANDRSIIVRMPPGVTDPKQATKIELPSITAGDKMIALGKLSDDKKTLEAARIYVLTKSDIAEIHKQEDEEWQKRGIGGEVVSVDAAGKKFTIKSGSKQTTIVASDKTEFKRYSPDSFKSTDAKPSSLAEIQPNDQVRILGNKSSDESVAADRVFFGTFHRYSATIDTIDTAANELKVKDLDTKKNLVIKIDPESQVKKLAPEMADMLAKRFNPNANADGGRGRGGAGRGGPGGPGGRGGGPNIAQVFDRAPAVQLATLKHGDAIVVLSTAGSTPGRVTAVMVVAGVEPLLSWSGDVMSGWSIGGGGGGEGN